MATMRVASPGTIAAVFSTLRSADSQSASPILETFVSTVVDLEEAQAQDLPFAVASVLPLLEGDPIRLQLAVDLVETFDLFEALPSLLTLAGKQKDESMLLAAASLAANPGVWPREREALRSLREGLIDRSFDRAFEIRTDPTTVPRGHLEGLLHAQRWPGLAHRSAEVASPVAIDERNAPYHLMWLISADLRAAGASIRRIPETFNSEPMPGWLGTGMPIISWDPEYFPRLRQYYPDLSSSQLISVGNSGGARERVVAAVAKFLGKDSGFRMPAVRNGSTANAVSPDVFKLGSLDAHELSVLGGIRRSALYGPLKEVLPPRSYHKGSSYWGFDQLVGLRTWQYFKAITGKRNIPPTIVRNLVAFAGASSPTAVGVTADGEVLHRDGQQWLDVQSGQVYLEAVRTLDDVFEPFAIGAGSTPVPALLTPSYYSKVHPAYLGGSPRVTGTRIPVRAVARLARDQDEATAARAYELTEDMTRDLFDLGNRLITA
jgi:uncharacterized protein (DUF433 family)